MAANAGRSGKSTVAAVLFRFAGLSGGTARLNGRDLAGLDHLDEIVVLDHGRVAERGTHRQLLQAGGVYHRLWQACREVADDTSRCGDRT